jgi:hypothetical protein
MEGGRIIGEGVDGCVISEPLWPCAASAQKDGQIPDGSNKSVVSKIVQKADTESFYLEAAARILGPQLSSVYLAGIRGKCSPANSMNPPVPEKAGDYKESVNALETWERKGQACEDLQKTFKKGITASHKLMYISRYPSNLNEWLNTLHERQIPFKPIIKGVNQAVPPFIDILQRFYQNPAEELINLDLHHFNIFVRAAGQNVQFGVSDFGRSLLRRRLDPVSSKKFIVDYLREHVKFTMYSDYKQVPFEARLLNFCFKMSLDNADPSVIMKQWINDPMVNQYATYTGDILILNRQLYAKYLLTRPSFIQMIEQIQAISKKIRSGRLESLSVDETTIIEFILTRYMAVSPFITILEQLSYYSNELRSLIISISQGHFNRSPKPETELYYLVEFLNRVVLAPYSSSMPLVQSLKSLESANLSQVWSDLI